MVDAGRHVQHGLAGFTDFVQLLRGGIEQLVGGAFYLARRLRHTRGRALHIAHQRAQLFHRVIHRVGNCTGDVFRHCGFLRQIALGHRLQLVHQPQNGRLICIINALGLLLLKLCQMPLLLSQRLALTAFVQLDKAQANSCQ